MNRIDREPNNEEVTVIIDQLDNGLTLISLADNPDHCEIEPLQRETIKTSDLEATISRYLN